MEILRTIIRFLIIIIAISILIFLSVTLFKLIPRGINQLASATVSLGNKQSLNDPVATTTTNQPVAQPAPVTSNGLNGVYSTQGDIVILDNAPTKYTSPKPVVKPSVPKPITYPTYHPTTPVLSGRKNLTITYSTMGIIKNGQFIATNTFNTEDTISVRFLVINEQDTPTGTWSMRVEMPTREYEDKVKILNNLNSIPGESTYSLEARFSGIDLSQGTPIVRIYLDTANQVTETNENDNSLAVEIKNISQAYYNNTGNNNTCAYNSYNCTYEPCTYNTYNCNNNTNTYSPNLSIISFEVGRVINGTFYSQSYINYGEKLAVRARVRNNGGYFSNSWSSKISLVDSNGFTRDYIPGSDSGLAAGSESTILYEIENLTRGTNRITFMADTSNNVAESNEGDNTQQTTIQVN